MEKISEKEKAIILKKIKLFRNSYDVSKGFYYREGKLYRIEKDKKKIGKIYLA